MTDFRNFEGSLLWLSAYGRISGSWSRGDQHMGSDVDIYLSRSHLAKLKKALNSQGVEWTSAITGAITWHPEGRMVEVSDLFPRYPPKMRRVMVHGVTFIT